MVKQHLISLNEFKSPGPDELHPRVIKELAEELSEPLSIIFAKPRKIIKKSICKQENNAVITRSSMDLSRTNPVRRI